MRAFLIFSPLALMVVANAASEARGAFAEILSRRQQSCISTACNDTSDLTVFGEISMECSVNVTTYFGPLPSVEATCVCLYLFDLSGACLSCLAQKPANNYTMTDTQQICNALGNITSGAPAAANVSANDTTGSSGASSLLMLSTEAKVALAALAFFAGAVVTLT